MAPVLSVLAIGLFAAAAVNDLARRRIPNELVLGLAGLALVRVAVAFAAGAGAGALAADAAAAVAIFAFGAGLFRFGLFGGGDAKLLAAGTLWVGSAALWPYLFTTVLAGGVLALGFVCWAGMPRFGGEHRTRASLPYGVAIAAGGILTTAAGL